MLCLDLPPTVTCCALVIYCTTPLIVSQSFSLCIDLTHDVVKDYVTKPGTQKLTDSREICEALPMLAESAAPAEVL